MVIFINAKILYASSLELKNCKISVSNEGAAGGQRE